MTRPHDDCNVFLTTPFHEYGYALNLTFALS